LLLFDEAAQNAALARMELSAMQRFEHLDSAKTHDPSLRLANR
jgi:hypothetical protein